MARKTAKRRSFKRKIRGGTGCKIMGQVPNQYRSGTKEGVILDVDRFISNFNERFNSSGRDYISNELCSDIDKIISGNLNKECVEKLLNLLQSKNIYTEKLTKPETHDDHYFDKLYKYIVVEKVIKLKEFILDKQHSYNMTLNDLGSLYRDTSEIASDNPLAQAQASTRRSSESTLGVNPSALSMLRRKTAPGPGGKSRRKRRNSKKKKNRTRR